VALAAPNACERQIAAAAQRYGIPEGILYAVGLTETGRKGSLHPWSLNIAGKAVFAPSQKAAVAAFNRARNQGVTLIDLGCMQINHHYHGTAFSSPGDMLDPAHNVDYAARFLSKLKASHDTWSMAVARYHAGPDNDPAQKRYICRVVANLAATGYGEWTPAARKFCEN
jgi:soluble lytic murein transglycosylase-like protein